MRCEHFSLVISYFTEFVSWGSTSIRLHAQHSAHPVWMIQCLIIRNEIGVGQTIYFIFNFVDFPNMKMVEFIFYFLVIYLLMVSVFCFDYFSRESHWTQLARWLTQAKCWRHNLKLFACHTWMMCWPVFTVVKTIDKFRVFVCLRMEGKL